MKNYSDCGFQLHLPEATKYPDKLVINSLFVKKVGKPENYVIHKIKIHDCLNNYFECVPNTVYGSDFSNKSVHVEVKFTDKKILVKGAEMTMEILSEYHKKTMISFTFTDMNHTVLNSVSNSLMTEAENVLCKKIISGHKKEKRTAKDNGFNHIHNSTQMDERLEYDSVREPNLKRYLDALNEEKKFLMSEGGRTYKVTNGKLISGINNAHIYSFDLETELFISDDAPVTVTIYNEKIKGTVVMCEDFQIVISLEKKMGTTIGIAFVNVEPWKLLEALEERLKVGYNFNATMTKNLLEKGPKLSTRENINNVKKGQELVIQHALQEPVTIVWGPPGTGKTHTMSELAIKYIDKGYSVLIVSHSNVSVDGVAEKIFDLLQNKYRRPDVYQKGKVLRYGYVRNENLHNNSYINSFKYAVKQYPSLDKELEELQREYVRVKHQYGIACKHIIEINKKIGEIHHQIKDKELEVIRKASVVITTISKATIDQAFSNRMFDVVMFDEISMAYVLQVACAATFCKKHLVCVGDFKQLEPIAQSNAKKVLCEDLFTHLKINVNGKAHNHPWLIMLDEQYRMHPDIVEFSNNNFYYGMIKTAAGVKDKCEKIVDTAPFFGKTLTYINLQGCHCSADKNQDNSRYNILSAIISVVTALQIHQELDKVSIISPYAAQTRLILAMLKDYKERNKQSSINIRCATVHQFQGSESDVVLFDPVESYPGEKVGYLLSKEMDSVNRLINVALTRAKGKFITIANLRFWDRASKRQFSNKRHAYCEFQKHILNKGNIVSHSDKELDYYLESLTLDESISLYTAKTEYSSQYINDLMKAKKGILISLPSGKLDDHISVDVCKQLYEAKKRGVTVFVKTNDFQSLPPQWKDIAHVTKNATFPLTIIDDKLTWYGAPTAEFVYQVDEQTTNKVVCNVFARIKGEYTAEIIKSLCNLEEIELDQQQGLASYISKKYLCPKCQKTPLCLVRGKSRKAVLWCKTCADTELLKVDVVDQYVDEYDIKCPRCKSRIWAQLGSRGIYLKCAQGHTIKPEQI